MSGGRITLAIYIAIGITGAAFGQNGPTYLPPPALQPIAVKPAPLARPPDTVIIRPIVQTTSRNQVGINSTARSKPWVER